MPKLFPVLLLCLTLTAKTKQSSTYGPILEKGSLGSWETLKVAGATESDPIYICVIETQDPKFRDYKVGDIVLVGGMEKDNSRTLRRCKVVVWKQK